MGWSWERNCYYGIHIDSRATGKAIIEELKREYSKVDWVSYPYGGIIMYIYSINFGRDNGSYAVRFPDTRGTDFDKPKHPIFFFRTSGRGCLDLTSIMKSIKEKCVLLEPEFSWYDVGSLVPTSV